MQNQEDKINEELTNDILNEIKRNLSISESILYARMRKYYKKSDEDKPFDDKCYFIIKSMIEKGYIIKKNSWYSLSREGEVVAQKGIKNYKQDLIKEKELKIKERKTTILNNQISIFTTIVSLLSIIFGALIRPWIDKLIDLMKNIL